MGNIGDVFKAAADSMTPWVAPISPVIAAAGQVARFLGDFLGSNNSDKGKDPTQVDGNGPNMTNGGNQNQGLGQDNGNENDINLDTTNDNRVNHVTSGASSPTNSITSTNTVSPVVTANTSSQLEQAQEVMVQSQAQGSYDIQGTRSQSGASFSVAPVVTIPVMDQNNTTSAAETTSPTLAEVITPVAIAVAIGYFGVRAVKAWRDTNEQ